MQKMEKGTASDNIELLQHFKSPLQRFVHEIEGNNQIINKDIIDFDRKFFMGQLTTLKKSYNEEIKQIYIKTREKAIKYIEIQIANSKEKLEQEMVKIVLQYQELKRDHDLNLRKMKELLKEKKTMELRNSEMRIFAESDFYGIQM